MLRYEVWSIQQSATKYICKLSMKLEGTEIWLLLRQSLRHDMMNTWKMQIPLSISEDIKSFSALRTVYRISENPKVPGEWLARSAILPLDSHPYSHHNWSDDRKGFGPCLNTQIPLSFQWATHTLYEYRLVLAPQAQYAAVVEPSTPSNIAIYEIEEQAEKLIVSEKNSIPCDQLVGRLPCIFHPYLPLVAFCTCFGISLWSFLSSK